MDADREIILITGQSGIKTEKCLHTVKNDCNVTPISFEKLMENEGKSFKSLLASPRQEISRIWNETFEKNLGEGGSIGGEGNDYPSNNLMGNSNRLLLNLHASYFHQMKKEFFSPVDFNLIQQLKGQVKSIIVFIDDCYDIYRRLMSDGEMFHHILSSTTKPYEAIIESISNVINILHWREIEISYSRSIAQSLGNIPLYVLSVKHPVSVLRKLITEHDDLKKYYLAHPITEVRNKVAPRNTTFPGDLSNFVEDIYRNNENIVLFIPDTIDEKRIKKSEFEDVDYEPKLNESWPLPFEDNLIYTDLPNNVKDLNPLNPQNKKDFNDGERRALSSLLGVLDDKIYRQIGSRDFTLVEQSDGIVAYEPYWGGNLSSGVFRELYHNNRLRNNIKGEEKRQEFIYYKIENLKRSYIHDLKVKLKASLKSIADEDKDSIEKLVSELIKSSQIDQELFSNDRPNKNKIRDFFEEVLPDTYTFTYSELDGEVEDLMKWSAEMVSHEEKRNRGWDKLFQTAKFNPLKRFARSEESFFGHDGTPKMREKAKRELFSHLNL